MCIRNSSNITKEVENYVKGFSVKFTEPQMKALRKFFFYQRALAAKDLIGHVRSVKALVKKGVIEEFNFGVSVLYKIKEK